MRESVKMVYEIYKIIQDNHLSNRDELQAFLLQNRERYEQHLELVITDTIYFEPQAVQDMLNRLKVRLGNEPIYF